VEGLDDLLFLKNRANYVDALHRGRVAVASYLPFGGNGTAENVAKTLGWTWRNGNGLGLPSLCSWRKHPGFQPPRRENISNFTIRY
jgi:hypothetical protein